MPLIRPRRGNSLFGSPNTLNDVLPGFALSTPEPVVLARAASSRGEIVLRRRGVGTAAVEELIVNGAFAMDSRETSSERELALMCQGVATGGRLLVGGLGLGYTAAEALALPWAGIDVVELEPALVQWARQGLTAVLAQVAGDLRVNLIVADVATVLTGTAGTPGGRRYDAVVLDVDNGPDFLIHDANAELYTDELLTAAYGRLTAGGRLAIWSQGPSEALLSGLRHLASNAEEHLFAVTRGARQFSYAIYTLDRPPTP